MTSAIPVRALQHRHALSVYPHFAGPEFFSDLNFTTAKVVCVTLKLETLNWVLNSSTSGSYIRLCFFPFTRDLAVANPRTKPGSQLTSDSCGKYVAVETLKPTLRP